MKRDTARNTMRSLGITLIVGGAAIASPLDEVAITAATAGAGGAVAPIQGPTTLVAGLASIALGIALLREADR